MTKSAYQEQLVEKIHEALVHISKEKEGILKRVSTLTRGD